MNLVLRRTTAGARLICCGLILVTSWPLWSFEHGLAAASSGWLGSTDLGLTVLGALPTGSVPPNSINGNMDCSQQLLTTRPEIHAPLPPHILLQSALTTTGCVVQTGYGIVDSSSSNIQPFDTDEAGPITTYNTNGGLVGVPNSFMGITFTGSTYLQFTLNVMSHLKSTVNPLTQTVSYSLTGAPDYLLADHDQHSLPVNYDSISFSANGRWMVVNSPGHALLRVDLLNLQVVAFAMPFNYTSGLGPNPQTAITNDGRYVAAGSTNFARLDLYDLSTCAATPTTITGPTSCQSRNLWSVLQAKLPGLATISTVRFVDDDIVSIYAGVQASPGNALNVSKYDLTTSGHSLNQLDYLALGDSFSSGEGAYSYQIGTDDGNDQCHLSTVSYPYLIADRLASNAYHSVACSGATMNDILGSGDDYPGQVKDKIPLYQRDVPDILQSFTPGYINELKFVSHYVPRTITITVAGDDIHFADIIKECIADIFHGSCYSSYEDRLELSNTINAQLLPLAALYTQLKRDSSPDTRIYAVGYPQIAKPGGNCADNVHLNASELELANSISDEINAMVQAAATTAGVRYIDVSRALVGHRLCETNSSDVAINGLTAGNNIPGPLHGPIGNESYHPNQLGHQLLAKSILAGTSNFTLSPPSLVTPVPAPSPLTNPSVANAPVSGRAVHTLIPTAIFDPVLTTGQTYSTSLSGARLGLMPNATYSLTGGDQKPSTVQSDSNANLSITLPPTLASGYQTIDLTGPNQAGQTVDIRQLVYLIGNPTNPDSNGGLTDQQGCLVVPPSGHDIDQDGLDDACDGYIGDPPPPAPLPTPVPIPITLPVSNQSATSFQPQMTVNPTQTTTADPAPPTHNPQVTNNESGTTNENIVTATTIPGSTTENNAPKISTSSESYTPPVTPLLSGANAFPETVTNRSAPTIVDKQLSSDVLGASTIQPYRSSGNPSVTSSYSKLGWPWFIAGFVCGLVSCLIGLIIKKRRRSDD